MTSLWRITTGADGSCNLLEIGLLRLFPDGEFGAQSADTRIEAQKGLWETKNPSWEWFVVRFSSFGSLTESTYFVSF